MSRSKRCTFVSVTLLVALLFAIAKAEQLPIRTYTTADGLARDRVYKIVSDPHGFLWFCTYDGLSRFDGSVYDNERIFDALCAGACGYLLKKTPWPKLAEALKEAVEGGSPMSPEVARRVISLFREIKPPQADYPVESHVSANGRSS